MFRNLKLAVVAASLLFVGSAAAQPDRDGGDRSSYKDRKGKRGEFRAKRLAKFDTNKDGKLDRAERKAIFKARFDKADKNGDGVLSIDEAETLVKRGFGGKRNRSKQP